MILENRTTEEGDVIYMESDIPALGISVLIGFVDHTDGETQDSFYSKEFQYSTNGITWSEWYDLTLENLLAIDVTKIDLFYVKYRYTHVGSETLEFDSNILTGLFEQSSLDDYYYFNGSIFSKYFSFNSLDVVRWYVNVTQKLYEVDLNKYMNFADKNGNPTDAISIWQSVTRFFAYYVILARVYSKFYTNVNILNSYLIQRGLFTPKNNILTELQYLMKNLNTEVANRGSVNIIKNKSENEDLIVDGELLRYLNVDVDKEEFVFNYFLPQHCGWWVDHSSPTNKGLENHLNANKIKIENINPQGGDIIINPLDKNDWTIYSESELSLIYDQSVKPIPVAVKENYILEFKIKIKSPSFLLSVGLKTFDINNTELQGQLYNFQNGQTSSSFYNNEDLSRYASFDIWLPIKCIVYNLSKPYPFGLDKTNTGVGNNLIFNNNLDIRKIYPTISTEGECEIKDLSFRQLYTNYERGFINMNHFVSLVYDFDRSAYHNEGDPQSGFQYTLDFGL